MPEKLKPCPACGGDAYNTAQVVYCISTSKCGVVGPWNDPDGAKWNALPRRTDASQGMDGFELVARAIIQIGIGLLAQRGTMTETEPGRINELNGILTAELDRRAAARKESKP